MDVCQLEHHEDGEEGSDPGNGREASHPRIVPPALDERLVEAPDLLVQQAAQRKAVLPDRGGDRREGQGVEFSLPADGRPALPRGRLEVAPGQEGQQPVRHPRSLPDQGHAMPDELSSLPHGRRGIHTVGSRSPRRSCTSRSASTRSFFNRAAAIARVCFGWERTG